MINKDESKADKFKRVAEPRVTRACKAVNLLGNLAASSYEYSEEQVNAMFAAVQYELDTAREKFRKREGVGKFTLS